MKAQRHRWRRRALLAAAVVAGGVVALAAGVAVTRAVTHDGLTRDDAAECATNVQWARHSPREMEACITRAVRADVRRDGVVDALVAVQRDANRSPILKAECHLALHELGREQQRAGLTVTELDVPMEHDANWNSSCAGGFLHGYLQAMAESASRGELLALGREWCASLAEQNRKGCAHAVGHGLSRSDDNDIARTARGCGSLPRNLRGDCMSGAVMELNFADQRLAGRMRDDHGIGPAKPIRCGSVPRDQRRWCRALRVKGEVLIAGLRTIA